jgi:predicted metal-dependent peptidase
MAISQETRLKKAHIALMKHRETALYSGVMLMGKNSVIEDNVTAYTNGVDKKYGREFISKLTDAELRGLILHENLHVALKHIPRFKKEFKDNAQAINVATDYAVNDVIMNLKDRDLCHLPEGGLYDAKYHNWSVREIYEDLKKQQQQNKDSGGGESLGKTLDEHDFENAQSMTDEEAKEMSSKIDKALREGGILAGRMGAKIPRVIGDMLEPKVDWREVLREFVNNATKGSDEYTWRKFNKRQMANDIYLPSMENESIGELIVAIDTSGSIGGQELTEFASELASICSVATPSKVRVLWWDTEVHGEQVFLPEHYGNIKELLKPQGGGGTMVSCVSEHLNKQRVEAEAVIVFTDGYLESEITWNVKCPTLWLVTQNNNFVAPSGKVVKKND